LEQANSAPATAGDYSDQAVLQRVESPESDIDQLQNQHPQLQLGSSPRGVDAVKRIPMQSCSRMDV